MEYSKGAEWGFIIAWQARAIVILKCSSVNVSLLGAAVIDAGRQFPKEVT